MNAPRDLPSTDQKSSRTGAIPVQGGGGTWRWWRAWPPRSGRRSGALRPSPTTSTAWRRRTASADPARHISPRLGLKSSDQRIFLRWRAPAREAGPPVPL